MIFPEKVPIKKGTFYSFPHSWYYKKQIHTMKKGKKQKNESKTKNDFDLCVLSPS